MKIMTIVEGKIPSTNVKKFEREYLNLVNSKLPDGLTFHHFPLKFRKLINH